MRYTNLTRRHAYDFTKTRTASNRDLELKPLLQLNTKYFFLEHVASEQIFVVSGLSSLVGFLIIVCDFFAKAIFADLQDTLLLRWFDEYTFLKDKCHFNKDGMTVLCPVQIHRMATTP